MIRCTKCGHQNLPSYPTCGKRGAPLAGAAEAQAQDQYRQLAVERAAKARRTRIVYMGFGLVALGVIGAWMVKDSQNKGKVQEKLDYAERWVSLEKKETGLFWNCVLASEVDVGLFANAGQIQQRIEAAYATQQKTFSDHLLTECIPRMERALQAFAGLPEPPAELKGPLEAYKKSLPGLQDGVQVYAERIKNRGASKDVDQLIQEMGQAWHSEVSPNSQTIAYDKFLRCAIPGLDKLKDSQGLVEFFADACYKKDAVSFMDRVRKECGPILENADAAGAAAKTYKATQKRLYEEDARQLSAWADCGRRARKGKKVEDLGEFLVAVGEYMTARSGFVEAARNLQAGGK
jgi:hypothetical protein